ncbi:MBL fold metallo-hydrolase [Cereibacter sphaeroides]|nr:MBL fold metallo-hydrolase [Cereibacter sphaeroides]
MSFPILTFHGAARGVTGSCFRLQTATGTLLIDCGMFQGSKTEKALNYRPLPFDPAKIDAALLTHAHIDHSGLLPKLVHDGFAGPIHATRATVDLCGVMLPDSAHIQALEVQQLNRRRARWNSQAVEPIYDGADVDRTMAQFRGQDYGEWVQVLPGTRARFWNAGHMLGSSSIELEVMIPGHREPMSLLFSGDLGPAFKLLHPDPEGPSGVDYVICESTYGGTDRFSASDEVRRKLLTEEVRAAINPAGALLIPSFAVERAQELIADLTQSMAEGLLPEIPIYVDSPLAARATEVFHRHRRTLEHGNALAKGLHAPNLHFTQDVEDSKRLDDVQGFHIVIAASGMCEAGRIRHRLKRWLWSEAATVMMAGYQAQGTLGRLLLDGAKSVRIQGEALEVRARIRAIDLYSGHADGPELQAWLAARTPIRHGLFLTHGEPPAMDALAEAESAALTVPVIRPSLDQGWRLTPAGPQALPQDASTPTPRIRPEAVANLDWHNDVSKLFLDLNEALTDAGDEKARNVLIRKLRSALGEWSEGHPH